jgi:hypothetical protein
MAIPRRFDNPDRNRVEWTLGEATLQKPGFSEEAGLLSLRTTGRDQRLSGSTNFAPTARFRCQAGETLPVLPAAQTLWALMLL